MANDSDVLEVGTARARRGEVTRGVIPVTTLPGGKALDIPLAVIRGEKPGPCFWVDGAIHGDEPEGPRCCQLLLAEVKPSELSGTLVLVPAMNVPAFEAANRINPLDSFAVDMNRIYPGKPNGYLTERVAWAHAEVMKRVADMEICIHSGGAHSYLSETIFLNEDPKSIALAKAMGKGWVVQLSAISPKGNPMAVMLEAGKTGITVELGGRSATGPDSFRRVARVLADAALNIMRTYKMLPGDATVPEVRHAGVQEALLAPTSGLFLPEPGVDFQTAMKKGDVIARIVGLFGDELAVLTAPADGMIFGLRALPSVVTGDWCCFYAKVSGTRDD